jgi:hypothetical protein
VLSNEKDPFWMEVAPSRIVLERTSPSAQRARQSKVSSTTALGVAANTKGRPWSVVPLYVVGPDVLGTVTVGETMVVVSPKPAQPARIDPARGIAAHANATRCRAAVSGNGQWSTGS